MKDNVRTVSTILTYSGALPFWILALAPDMVWGFDTTLMFLAYGAVIGSFMAGALWGSAQSGGGNLAIIIASNVLALVAFATLVAGPVPISLLVQMALFGLLLMADQHLLAANAQRQWYWTLRIRITLLVALAYCVMLIGPVLGW